MIGKTKTVLIGGEAKEVRDEIYAALQHPNGDGSSVMAVLVVAELQERTTQVLYDFVLDNLRYQVWVPLEAVIIDYAVEREHVRGLLVDLEAALAKDLPPALRAEILAEVERLKETLVELSK